MMEIQVYKKEYMIYLLKWEKIKIYMKVINQCKL